MEMPRVASVGTSSRAHPCVCRVSGLESPDRTTPCRACPTSPSGPAPRARRQLAPTGTTGRPQIDVADPARHNDKGNVAVAQHPVCQVDVAVACVANSRFAHGNHSGITEVSGMSDPRRKPCACVSRMTPGPSPRASGTPRCSSPPARALETQKARPAGRRPPIGRSEPSTSTVRCAAWSAGRGVD